MSGWLNAIKTDAPEASVEPNAPSAPTASSSVTKVVVDTNAIVKGFRLERFADEAVTIPEVLAEVRDRQARHTLATLPFELKVQDPDADSIAAVRRFAKLTGDIGALSEPDVRCIALAYMLERDAHGTAHLRTSPAPVVLSKHKHNKASKMAGWDFVPNQDDWAELDEMNAEAEAAAEAVAKRMAAATVADDTSGTPSPKLPKSARIAAEVAAEVAAERGAGSIPDAATSERGDVDADDGWERNVSRTTRVKHAKREQRRREAEEEQCLVTDVPRHSQLCWSATTPASIGGSSRGRASYEKKKHTRCRRCCAEAACDSRRCRRMRCSARCGACRALARYPSNTRRR